MEKEVSLGILSLILNQVWREEERRREDKQNWVSKYNKSWCKIRVNCEEKKASACLQMINLKKDNKEGSKSKDKDVQSLV